MNAKKARRLLEQERDRLERVRRALEEGGLDEESLSQSIAELSSLDQHPADLGTESFERAKERSILEQVEAGLADVGRGLAHLEAGTYGRCEACGKPIPASRLAARPATRFCVKDQALAEREARAGASFEADIGRRRGVSTAL